MAKELLCACSHLCANRHFAIGITLWSNLSVFYEFHHMSCWCHYFHSAGDPQPPSLSVRVNDRVTASCSVTHTCPLMPPRLSWSRSGVVKRRTKRLNAGTWKTVSTLVFTPHWADFRKPLNCTAQYSVGKQVMSSAILWIQCDPSAWPKYHLSVCTGNKFMSQTSSLTYATFVLVCVYTVS